ncbi:ABC transporter substrate-binding protein [Terrarubrum flagellatum]|uniref:ABC transporter substrate-binding protein n=1 Tax=Terrirubrum flagellatum TaxID=2895980 RepID=UPI003144EE05
MRKTWLGLALAGTIGFCLASGGAQAQTLKIWGPEQLTDPLVAQLWNELKADFEKLNPGVTVTFTPPTGTINTGAVQAAIQSNAGPDLVLTNSGIGRVQIVAKAKLVQPLTGYYESRGWKNQLYPWLYAELKKQFGGEIYEIPDGLDVIGMFYHKDMFEEKGWKIPATYQDFLKLLEDIKKSGVQPITVGPRNNANGGHLFGNLLQISAGKEMVGKALNNEAAWTDPALLKGAERLRELVDRGFVARDMAALDLDAAARLFFTRRAAIMVAGPWFTTNARRANFSMDKAGYAPMPSDLGSAESIPTGGVGWSWMIPTTTKQQDLALKWLDFILSDAVMMKRAEHASSWMVYPRQLKSLTPPQPILKSVFEAADKGVGYNPSVYMPGNVLDAYLQVIQGLIAAQIDAKTGMDQLKAQAERAAQTR